MFQPHSLFIGAFALYLAAFAASLGALFSNRAGWQTKSRRAGWLGAAFHGAGVIWLAATSSHFPVAHPSETYAFLSLIIILFHLAISLRYSVSVLSLFTLPLVAFLMLAAHLAAGGEAAALRLTGYWLSLHVVLTFISYGAFALAFASAVGYLVQDRQLKSHHPGKLFRWMPPLGVLDEINTRALVFGFLLLTLGLLSGFFWAKVSGGRFWIDDPKVGWASVIWFLYAALLSARITQKLRGRKVALGSIVGFAIVIISFIGIGHSVLK